MSVNDKILVPPINIGDKLYTKGHGNRKTPEEWDVVYLGYNGEHWFVTIVLYHDNEFIKSMQIEDSWIDNIIFYRDKKLFVRNMYNK